MDPNLKKKKTQAKKKTHKKTKIKILANCI